MVPCRIRCQSQIADWQRFDPSIAAVPRWTLDKHSCCSPVLIAQAYHTRSLNHILLCYKQASGTDRRMLPHLWASVAVGEEYDVYGWWMVISICLKVDNFELVNNFDRIVLLYSGFKRIGGEGSRVTDHVGKRGGWGGGRLTEHNWIIGRVIFQGQSSTVPIPDWWWMAGITFVDLTSCVSVGDCVVEMICGRKLWWMMENMQKRYKTVNISTFIYASIRY